MNREGVLRDHLHYLLDGGGAHPSFESVVADLPVDLVGAKVKGLPHTPWQLLEHLRIAQWDILEFSRDPEHVSPVFPDGYWPATEEPPEQEAWNTSVAACLSDLQAMQDLVATAEDLFAPIPGGEGQTLLREALLVADHNAWHLGQLLMLRRLLEA